MTFTPNQLTVKALRVLEFAWGEAQAGPLPRSSALRFVLAYLFSRTNGRERWLFDQFWTQATRPAANGADTYGDTLARSYGMTAAINGIYREVGVERTPEMMFIAASRSTD